LNRSANPPQETDICGLFLKKLDKTPDRDRRLRILRLCSGLDRPWVEPLLWRSLADPHELVRDFLVDTLVRRELSCLDLARDMLRRPPWFARCAVIKVATRRRMREMSAAAAALIRDPNVEVRRHAAEFLGEVGGKEALKLLVKMRKDANPYVRAEADRAIQKVSDIRFT